jgi:hypothetical protein
MTREKRGGHTMPMTFTWNPAVPLSFGLAA